MIAELIKKEGNKVTLKITVDNNKFEAAVNKAYNKSRNNTIYLDLEKVKLQELL